MLFERAGPKIRLTPAGELLLEMALPLVEGVEKLSESFAARLGSVNNGTLSIASGEATLLYILPELIKEFSSKFPQVDVRLHNVCLLYTSPSPRDATLSRMPSSA